MNNQYTLHLLPEPYLERKINPLSSSWSQPIRYPIIGTFTGKEGDIWEEKRDFRFYATAPFIVIPITQHVEGEVNIDFINKLISQKESELDCNCEIEGHYYKQVPEYNACPKHEPEKYAAEKLLQKEKEEVMKIQIATKSVESVRTIDDSTSYAKHWAKKELGSAFQTQPVEETQEDINILLEAFFEHYTPVYKKEASFIIKELLNHFSITRK